MVYFHHDMKFLTLSNHDQLQPMLRQTRDTYESLGRCNIGVRAANTWLYANQSLFKWSLVGMQPVPSP
eukprot:6214434-Pleurochrysis_carterae.AAC.2